MEDSSTRNELLSRDHTDDSRIEHELNLKDFIAVFMRRRKLIFIIFSLIVLVSLLYAFLSTPMYQARTKLLISTAYGRTAPSAVNEDFPLMERYMITDALRNMDTQMEIVKSRPIIEEMAARLKLDDKLNENKKEPKEKRHSDNIDDLFSQITVESMRSADIISIKVMSGDPELARDIANTTAEVYIENSRRLNQEAAAAARRFTEEQLSVLKLNLDKAERAVRKFKERTGISDLQAEIRERISQTARLEAQIVTNEAELKNTRARLEVVRDQMKREDPIFVSSVTISNNPVVMDQQKRISELRIKQAGLLEEYGPKHPDVISTENQIKEAQDSINKSMANIVSGKVKSSNPLYQKSYMDFANFQAQVLGLEASLSALRDVVSANRNQLTTLPAREQDLANLERDREVASKTYLILLEKLQNLRITEVSKLGSARIIEEATTPDTPEKPNKVQAILLGLFIGIFVSFLSAFGVEYLDDTVKTPEDCENVTRLPILGSIPRFKEDIIAKFGTPEEPPSAADSFRVIRSNVRFFTIEGPVKTLMITSPIPRDGKTMITVNLAMTSAKLDQKILIIDGDLRKPNTHFYFEYHRTPGLTNVIAEDCMLKDAIRQTRIPNLDIITAGAESPNPVELLESTKMQRLLDELKKMYDLIILDMAPVGLLPDAMVLSSSVDGVIVVAASGSTPRGALRKTLQRLNASKARLLGIVLNKIDFRKLMGYGYYSGYYYRHYYEKEDGGWKTSRKKRKRKSEKSGTPSDE